METKENRGPVASASSDNYAREITAIGLRRAVQDIAELGERGLVPDTWKATAAVLSAQCAAFAARIEEDVAV